ncbi:transmembrane protein 182-like isoform X1 [Poecilia reticulata]|uniref:transmembrane protein 182-like isoform X1 n=1 Tax=Poecilia reticulata TaxID=8081 RepID=UPI0004A34158|nr:PREDICTED: transmembrane protein 182-like isoform X1 [Poecilia reticulata]
MKIGAAALAGGTFGVVGTLCFLVAFSTDYWLVAVTDCNSDENAKPHPTLGKDTNRTKIQPHEATAVAPPWLTLHHEGFFRRCMFPVEPSTPALLASFITSPVQTAANPLGAKVCFRGYLFPLPVALGHVPETVYDATAVFRGFWTVLIVVGLLSALTGGLLLVCGVPFISSKLYRLGGAFLIAAAVLLLLLLLLFVLWMEAVDVRSYVLQKAREDCPDAEVSVHYGLSFMAAAAGVPLEVLSGLLFLLAGRTLRVGR